MHYLQVSEYKYIPLAVKDPATTSATAERAELVKRMFENEVVSDDGFNLQLLERKAMEDQFLMCGWKTHQVRQKES